ncbi:MAG: 4Fe-4S binding protein [Rectinemataceae bacterium]|nr:4Fe-4S binding protein [Spirochaetaceae bacterium]
MKQTLSARITRTLTRHRRLIQAIAGAGLYLAASLAGVPLLWILLGASVLGILTGKVFCRWLCPIGFLMEYMMGMSKDTRFQQLYQYHKLGCPIAWVTGFLNRLSLLTIRHSSTTCTSCGACDRACYLSTLEPAKYSLFRKGKDSPADAYACSRCLACVQACPNQSLALGQRTGGRQ